MFFGGKIDLLFAFLVWFLCLVPKESNKPAKIPLQYLIKILKVRFKQYRIFNVLELYNDYFTRIARENGIWFPSSGQDKPTLGRILTNCLSGILIYYPRYYRKK